MANPLPYIDLGNKSSTRQANQTWSSFSNTVAETSEIPEWKESRWCVSKAYDNLIREAVEDGYECYESLAEEMQFRLVMEIIKAEKSCIFSDADQDLELADCMIQILLTKGDQGSFDALYDQLITHFIEGRGNKSAYFANTINGALEDQLRTQAFYHEQERLYGDPDDIDEEHCQYLRG
jgi:hypothetical protein